MYRSLLACVCECGCLLFSMINVFMCVGVFITIIFTNYLLRWASYLFLDVVLAVAANYINSQALCASVSMCVCVFVCKCVCVRVLVIHITKAVLIIRLFLFTVSSGCFSALFIHMCVVSYGLRILFITLSSGFFLFLVNLVYAIYLLLVGFVVVYLHLL